MTDTSVKSDGRCPACGCVGPNPGYIPMEPADIKLELDFINSQLPSMAKWILAEDGRSLYRKFTCRNWQSAINSIQAISVIAEREDFHHHPDLHLTNYRIIEIRLSTHAANGLTNYDFKLASALGAIDIDYSPKWLKENSTTN